MMIFLIPNYNKETVIKTVLINKFWVDNIRFSAHHKKLVKKWK